jgi:hypothetical protein
MFDFNAKTVIEFGSYNELKKNILMFKHKEIYSSTGSCLKEKMTGL